MNAKVVKGDVIYIYLAVPYKQLGFVCDVIATDFDQDSIMENIRLFFKNKIDKGEKKNKKQKKFMKLKARSLVALNKDSSLTLQYLKSNGLNGILMGSRKLENNLPLLTYIQKELP